jgi:hypothetical protein
MKRREYRYIGSWKRARAREREKRNKKRERERERGVMFIFAFCSFDFLLPCWGWLVLINMCYVPLALMCVVD